MNKNKENVDLSVGSVWRGMLSFVWPIFLGTLFQSLYTMADAIIIGRYAGKGALASIEAVLQLTKLPMNFFIGLASGATIIISQYYGAKKLDKVSTSTHNAILFAIVGGLFLSIIGIFLAPGAIRITKVPEAVANDAKIYLMIYFGGMVLSLIYNIGSAVFRSVGSSKKPFYFLIAANLVNIALDLFFVAVLDWGVVGAGVATVVASGVSALLIIIYLFRTELPCKIELQKLRFYKEHMMEIVKLGLPISIQTALYPIANTIVQSSINTLGVDSIAAWAIAGKLDFLVWNISSSFAFAISTFVAQNVGAKQFDRTRKGVRFGLFSAISLIAIVSTLLFFFSEYLAKLLLTDPGVIAINTRIIRFFVPFYFVYAISEGLPGAIRGTGDTFRPMIVSLIATCLFRILWIFTVVARHKTLLTVLGAYPASWILSALIFIVFYYLKFVRSRTIEMLKES